MLTPEYLQGLPAELEKLYLRLEEETISDISRRIAKVGHITDTAEYQILRMRELGAGTEYIKSKIKEYSGLSDDVVEQLFFDAAQVSDEFYKGAYDKAGKEYKPFEYNDFFQQIVVANVNQTKGELSNLTQSMGFSYRGSNGERRFRPVATAYRECLDYAFTQVETGTTDYITAIRNATRRLTESGLQFVDYDSGVVNHVDVAVRRAVLTGISQVTGKISEHNAAELETDIVEVTAHAGARPDHAEWQGGWYSLSGKSKKYRSLAEATGYGRVDGLKGANCRHDFFPVIEGVDVPLYTKEELANIDPPPFEYNGKRYTYYEATQKQRSMERAIRKTKREILAADKSGDKDRFTEKSIRLRRQREEYEKFSKSAGLLTQNERNQVVGFGRSEASRASWADKQAHSRPISVNATPPNMTNSGGVANRNILESKEYLLKFKGVTTLKIPLADRRVAECAKKCIYDNSGKNTESMYLVSAVTGKVKSGNNSLGVDGKEGKLYLKHDAPKDSLILVHNHPYDVAFSHTDFATINCRPEIKTIIAVTPNGTVYKLTRGKGKTLDIPQEKYYNENRPLTQYELSQNRKYDDFYNKWTQKYVESGKGDLGAVEYFAKKLGWEFTYE